MRFGSGYFRSVFILICYCMQARTYQSLPWIKKHQTRFKSHRLCHTTYIIFFCISQASYKRMIAMLSIYLKIWIKIPTNKVSQSYTDLIFAFMCYQTSHNVKPQCDETMKDRCWNERNGVQASVHAIAAADAHFKKLGIGSSTCLDALFGWAFLGIDDWSTE